MQSTAKLNYLRLSPRKIRLLVDLVRGMKVDDAITQLQLTQKKAARPLLKLIESGIANAEHNHGMSPDSLVIAQAYVNGGPIIYRWMPRAFGRASKIRKRTSHVTIVLEGEATEKRAEKKSQPAEAEAVETVQAEAVTPKKKAAPKKKTTKTTKKEA